MWVLWCNILLSMITTTVFCDRVSVGTVQSLLRGQRSWQRWWRSGKWPSRNSSLCVCGLKPSLLSKMCCSNSGLTARVTKSPYQSDLDQNSREKEKKSVWVGIWPLHETSCWKPGSSERVMLPWQQWPTQGLWNCQLWFVWQVRSFAISAAFTTQKSSFPLDLRDSQSTKTFCHFPFSHTHTIITCYHAKVTKLACWQLSESSDLDRIEN